MLIATLCYVAREEIFQMTIITLAKPRQNAEENLWADYVGRHKTHH
jgi:hypothetical protein